MNCRNDWRNIVKSRIIFSVVEMGKLPSRTDEASDEYLNGTLLFSFHAINNDRISLFFYLTFLSFFTIADK